MRLGTWGIKSLDKSYKRQQAIGEIVRYDLSILGVSKCGLKGIGKDYDGEFVTFYSGDAAIILKRELMNTLIEWEPLCDGIIRIRLSTKPHNTTIIQCCTTNTSEWYTKLSQIPDTQDNIIIMGNINYGAHLISFSESNNMKLYPNEATYVSYGGRKKKQTDYIITNITSPNIIVCYGANVGGNYYLVIMSNNIELLSREVIKKNRPFCVSKIFGNTFVRFVSRLRSRLIITGTEPIEEQWGIIKNAFVTSAIETIGYETKETGKVISPTTLTKIEERREIVGRLAINRSPKVEREYRAKNGEIRRCIIRDKKEYAKRKTVDIESADAMNSRVMLHKAARQFCNKKMKYPLLVKDVSGKRIFSVSKQADRWVQYYHGILNQPEPATIINPDIEESPEVSVCEPTEAEVRAAIATSKCGKSPGIDNIRAEMIRADTNLSVEVLTKLFSAIWREETIPNDWKEGLIVRVSKSGDPEKCDNWRGITLLSIPSKIFCAIILARIKNMINKKLREEQAGFRNGRGCVGQIFTLSNIIDYRRKRGLSTHIAFVDFKRAFDSVHRESLWRILSHYGVPNKIISLIKMFYADFKCRVVLDDSLSDLFSTKTGVRQGCVLSPILFIIATDWIMKNTINGRGIQLGLFGHLADLEYADDIALVETNSKLLQETLSSLQRLSGQIGLSINAKKTKIMHFGQQMPIYLDDKELEIVRTFSYLGSIISVTNGLEDITAKIRKARKAFLGMGAIWKSGVSDRTKIRLYEARVRSSLLYGSECWSSEAGIDMIVRFDRECLDKITSERTDYICLVIDEIRKKRLRFLGKVIGMQIQRLPRASLDLIISEPNTNNRTNWIKVIDTELLEIGITQEDAYSLSKLGWKKIIKDLHVR